MANFHRKAGFLLATVLFLAGMTLAPAASRRPAGAQALRAQPELLELAARQSGAEVAVIVQADGDAAALEGLIAGLGGAVTHRLGMIRALAARVPAARVGELAAAPGVRWVSLDAPTIRTSGGRCDDCVDTANLISAYVRAVGAERLWNEAPARLQGQGVTVAVVDSGIYENDAFSWSPGGGGEDDWDGDGDDPERSRIIARVKTNSNAPYYGDRYGHGSHVAGIIGGNGRDSQGRFIGVAPRVNLINVKVSDDQGGASVADVVAGLQWIYEHKDEHDIRVVNLSLNSSVSESYHTSPLDAAVEILWFSGIVVVVSAGNNGAANNGVLYPPANDPFVISVGAVNDQGTAAAADDSLAAYSAYGVTESGFGKPELLAPGSNIISVRGYDSFLSNAHPNHNAGYGLFRMSGTSMASAVTAGSVALLLQDEPDLTPDQVKHRLLATARPLAMGPYAGRYLDIYAAVHGTTRASSNTGIEVSQLLWTGEATPTWDSVSWNSVSWNSVSWNSVSWNSVSWNSVSWDP